MKVFDHLDGALNQLTENGVALKSRDFIVDILPSGRITQVKNIRYHGALLVDPSGFDDDLSLGIYLHESVRTCLESFESWRPGSWSLEQLRAFSVAAEEVSHFHYVAFQAVRNRQVTQLEIELQGEIDKFFVTYFALHSKARVSSPQAASAFRTLFDQCFFDFSLVSTLSSEEKERYLHANRVARRLVSGTEPHLAGEGISPSLLKSLRRFYRLGLAEKLSYSLAG